MNTESREHLSSLIDGEFSKETGRFLLRRLGADEGLRETWARYHLIRDCLRHQDGQLAQQDLTGRVRLALSTEPSIPAKTLAGKNWLRPLAGAAVAASVALIAVLTVSNGSQPGMMTLTPEVAAESFTSPNFGSMVPASQPVNLSGGNGGQNQKMNTYLLRHYQVTGEAGGRGFVSFVPIVVNQAASENEPVDEQESSDKDNGEPALR